MLLYGPTGFSHWAVPLRVYLPPPPLTFEHSATLKVLILGKWFKNP